MNIKNIVSKAAMFTLLMLIMLAYFKGIASAVPAYPFPVEVLQPDNTMIRIQPRGDEFYSWTEDEDGYTIIQDDTSNAWVYAKRAADGGLEATADWVGRVNPAFLGLAKGLRHVNYMQLIQQRKELMQPANEINLTAQRLQEHFKKTAQLQQGVQGSEIQLAPPAVIKNLVILVQFADLSFTVNNPKQTFEDFFNMQGYTFDNAKGSVKDFFLATTYNKVTIETVVTNVVTLNNGYAYYGAPYSGGPDIRPREMVLEAIQKLDAQNFNFAQCAVNGWIESLTIVHAGPGQAAGANANTIWAHKWQLISTYTAKDGTKLSTYNCGPELRGANFTPSGQVGAITRIGTACHELGHAAFGLPDLYDTSGASNGIGEFCLMASGSWNGGSGLSPSLFSAWPKYKLGLISPPALPSSGASIGTSATSDTAFYKFSGTSFNVKEFFLMENRQGIGFDAYLPGTQRGILIYHIDENRPNNNWNPHPIVAVEEAVGNDLRNKVNRGSDKQYFRSNNNASFTDTTTPNSLSYSGSQTGKPITSISASGALMTFSVNGNNPPGTHTISGTVTLNGSALSGVNVNISYSGGSTSVQTNTSGNYSYNALAGGTYTLTFSKTGYTFNPPSSTLTNLSAPQTVNSVATEVTHTISGTVTLNGSALSGVNVNISYSGGSTNVQTNASGNYSYNALAGGTYTLTFSKTGYTFNPASKVLSNLSAPQTVNSVATVVTVNYTISGTVTQSGGGALSGVNVNISYTGGSTDVQTNTSGNYSYSAPAGGTYTLTFSKAGYTFNPASKVLSNLSAAQTVNSVATAVPVSYTISGTVTLGGSALSGVNVNISYSGGSTNVQTNASGNYSYSAPAGGTYTLTFSKTGYTFNPASKVLSNLAAAQTVNSVATAVPVNYTISGTVTLGGSALSGVNVNISYSGGSTNVQTNTSGNYSYSALAGGTYTLTFSKTGYTFNPASKVLSNLAAAQTVNSVATSTSTTATTVELLPTMNGKGYVQCSAESLKIKIKNARPGNINMKIFTGRQAHQIKEQEVSNPSGGDIILQWDCSTNSGKADTGVYMLVLNGGGLSNQKLKIGIAR